MMITQIVTNIGWNVMGGIHSNQVESTGRESEEMPNLNEGVCLSKEAKCLNSIYTNHLGAQQQFAVI